MHSPSAMEGSFYRFNRDHPLFDFFIDNWSANVDSKCFIEKIKEMNKDMIDFIEKQFKCKNCDCYFNFKSIIGSFPCSTHVSFTPTIYNNFTSYGKWSCCNKQNNINIHHHHDDDEQYNSIVDNNKDYDTKSKNLVEGCHNSIHVPNKGFDQINCDATIQLPYSIYFILPFKENVKFNQHFFRSAILYLEIFFYNKDYIEKIKYENMLLNNKSYKDIEHEINKTLEKNLNEALIFWDSKTDHYKSGFFDINKSRICFSLVRKKNS